MKKRVAILGMGGVGGYLGGFLAKCYPVGDADVELIFIARGAHYRAISEGGLQMKTTHGNFTATPTAITDDTSTIGVVDYIIYTTKSYDTLSTISQLRPMIGPDTVIITFMNGVEGEEILREQLPQTPIWSGCAFIVSMIETPGTIYQDGKGVRYLFGYEDGDSNRMLEFEALCAKATELNVKYHKDIEVRVWSKLHFISAVGSYTTYSGRSTGDIMSTPELRATLEAIMNEYVEVSKAADRALIDNVVERNLETVHIMPYESSSSMQRDFAAGKLCEYEALCGYIVRLGERVGVPTPLYSKMYNFIKSKYND